MGYYEDAVGLGLGLQQQNNERLFQGINQLGQGLGAHFEATRPLSDMEQDLAAIQAGADPRDVAIRRRMKTDPHDKAIVSGAQAGGVPSLITGNANTDHDTYQRLMGMTTTGPALAPARTARDAAAAAAHAKVQAPVQSAQARAAGTRDAARITAGGRMDVETLKQQRMGERSRYEQGQLGERQNTQLTHAAEQGDLNRSSAEGIAAGQNASRERVAAMRQAGQSDPQMAQLEDAMGKALNAYRSYAAATELYQDSNPAMVETQRYLLQQYEQRKREYDTYMQQRGQRQQPGGMSTQQQPSGGGLGWMMQQLNQSQQARRPAAVPDVQLQAIPDEPLGQLTPEAVMQALPGADQAMAAAVLQSMPEAGITTKRQAAAYLAQLAHESGNFGQMNEIGGGARYEGRADLGNTQPGDGQRYAGRGFVQLTGRSNYEQASRALDVDLVNNPDLAADPTIAARIAAWYWRSRNLSQLAGAGDFSGVTRGIQGGQGGLADRQRRLSMLAPIFAGGQGTPPAQAAPAAMSMPPQPQQSFVAPADPDEAAAMQMMFPGGH